MYLKKLCLPTQSIFLANHYIYGAEKNLNVLCVKCYKNTNEFTKPLFEQHLDNLWTLNMYSLLTLLYQRLKAGVLHYTNNSQELEG